VALWVGGCNNDKGLPKPEPSTVKLSIETLEVLTESPQAGHPIQIRTVVAADENTEDISFIYVLRSVDDGDDAADPDKDTVLDACVESYVPATLLAESGAEVNHEFIATLTLPPETEGGAYHIYAVVDVLPTSNIETADAEGYDGENGPMIRVGTELRETPDLVIDDVLTDVKIVDLNPGDAAAPNDWTGTVLVTSFGGAPVEDVTITALLEIPGHPLQTLEIWNTHEFVQVWRNDGEGTFKDTRQRLGSRVANAVALGDIDGDGDLDLVAGNGNPDEGGASPNKVWRNDGIGSFSDSEQELGEFHTFGVALGDVDGDGDLDLVTGNSDGLGREPDIVYINQEEGLFSEGQRLGRIGDEGEEVLDDTYAVALGDLDGDGDLDLVTAGAKHRIWLNDGSGSFTDSGMDLGGVTGRAVLALADVDGDKDLDLVLGGPQAPLVLWRNNGTGTFQDSGQDFAGTEANAVALGDLDRDTDADLVVGLAGGGIEIRRNAGDGTFVVTKVSVDESPLGGRIDDRNAHTLALGDVNSDGLTDIVAGNDGPGGEPDMVWINDGVLVDASTPPVTSYRFRAGQELGGGDTRSLVLGDIDQDSDRDLDIVSGNLGLPGSLAQEGGVSGTFESTLVLPVLRQVSPTRIPIALRIPPEVEALIRAGTVASGGFLSTTITFCLDPFDDIPEYETSSFDPLRANDNCIAIDVAILARPPLPPGEDPDVVKVSSDREEGFKGENLAASINMHAESRQDKNGSLMVTEKTAPFGAQGYTADAYRVRVEGREPDDRETESRYTQDVELGGITVYTSTKSTQPRELAQVAETEDVETTLILWACFPPTSFAIEQQTEDFAEKTERKNKDDERRPLGENEKGRKFDKDDLRKDGTIGFRQIGPVTLVLRTGACGKLAFLFELNTPRDPYPDSGDEPDWPRFRPDIGDRFTSFQMFEASLSLVFFVEISLELNYGIVTIAIGIRGEIDLLKGLARIGSDTRRSTKVSDDPGAGDLTPPAERVITQNLWRVELRTLGGNVKFFLTLKIEIDVGLFSFSKSWTWEVPFAEWKGYLIASDGAFWNRKERIIIRE
jgi:hypothetical protein